MTPTPWTVDHWCPAWRCGSGSVFFSSGARSGGGRWGAHWIPWVVSDGEQFFDATASTVFVLTLHPGSAPRWVAERLAVEVVRGRAHLEDLDKYCQRRYLRYLERTEGIVLRRVYS